MNVEDSTKVKMSEEILNGLIKNGLSTTVSYGQCYAVNLVVLEVVKQSVKIVIF